MKMPFGKYAGVEISLVSLDYLKWMVAENHLCASDAKKEIERREKAKAK